MVIEVGKRPEPAQCFDSLRRFFRVGVYYVRVVFPGPEDAASLGFTGLTF